MKYLAFVFFVIVSIQHLSAQTPVEKAYAAIVNEGPSTGPNFIVVTIINSNTGESKEMILSINELFDCLKLELNESDSKKIKKYLLSKSSNRRFTLKNSEALKLIYFEKYKVKRVLKLERRIDKMLIKNHLIDSLLKIDTIRKQKNRISDEYFMLRREILKRISDSISMVRPLNEKEKRVLIALHDSYNDNREEQCEKLPNDTKDDSISRKNILEIWDGKINLYKSYKNRYADIENESARCEKKFFRDYYNKYGIALCQVLFKYGVICYFGDENPIVEFSEVIK